MSKKDVDNYFNEVSNNYHELLENLREMEDDVKNNLISPERLENLKLTIQPIKDNYETLSYIIFLLNKPTRKEKENGYIRRNKKFLSNIDKSKTKDGILENNRRILDNMKL